jgi:heat shock protein HtpX
MLNNWLKTTLLMAAIVALFGAVGMMLGGARGMLVALLLGGAMNLWAYWNSDKMVLRMYRAREAGPDDAPEFHGIVAELAGRAGLPMPRVYLIDEAQPNAFATGRDPEHAAVAATTGILRLLNARELRGVMAHELAHVKNRDILTSTISATLAGAISSLAQFGMFFGGDRERPNMVAQLAVMILAPLAAMLIQMAISRAREFGADRGGAEISGDPEALASALRKIEAYARGTPHGHRRAASGNRPDDDHQPLVRGRSARPVQHPPGHGTARGQTPGDGAAGPVTGDVTIACGW